MELVTRSEELKFLVGFFYFSGIRELYSGLKDNPRATIKVLVGLNADIGAHGLVEYAEQSGDLSDEERTYLFLQSVKQTLNAETFDTSEFREQVSFFLQLICNDRLVIRKTYRPNHAKVYIFKLDETQVGRKGLFITGSSNLTRAGLSTQEEFNVEISDYGIKDTEKYFDELWEEAVKITEDEATKIKIIEIIEQQTPVKDVTPFEAYVLVLKAYLDSFEQREIGQSLTELLERNGYKPYQYQLDAIRQSLAIIDRNNGVIIADVVGLGKSVIASAVARELRRRGIVICPPGLQGDKNKTSGWSMYVEQFGLSHLGWEVRSSGDLDQVEEYVRRSSDFEVVIVDEAHRFRNEDTKAYEQLQNICRGKIVILLTATPFNNRPADILALLKLFLAPKKSIITLENNLSDRFRSFKTMFERLAYIRKYHNSASEQKRKRAEKYYADLFGESAINLSEVKQRAQYLAKQIRDVIEPVTIRRNRLDLKNNSRYATEVQNLSKIADPVEWYFELSKEQSEFYDRVTEVYFADPDDGGRFTGAMYRPFEYEVELEALAKETLSETESFQYLQQRNLHDFMRRMLVKRFESSFGAFEQSIENFERISKHVLAFIEKSNKYILDRGLLEKIYDGDADEIAGALEAFDERLQKGKPSRYDRVYDLSNFERRDEFIRAIQSDIALFKEVRDELKGLQLVANDPKAACLLEHVEATLKARSSSGEPKRKVIIFTEYLDTVTHLAPLLGKIIGSRLLVATGSFTAGRIKEINRNFDASAAQQDDDYDVLLATDRMSEGFNLNRAGMVVNYDIPWNPVRVIQRVGRINRISKKVFDELQIVNFFPTEQGARHVKSREIAQNKMFLIHNALGEDAKIFDVDEEPTPAGLFSRIQRNPDELDKESVYTSILRRFQDIERAHPKVVASLHDCPPRVKVSKRGAGNEQLVFFKKGRMYVHRALYGADEAQATEMVFEDALGHIECEPEEQALPLSDAFWAWYMNIKQVREQQRNIPLSEQSLERSSLNVLETLIRSPWEAMMPQLDFLRMLREDIREYGTLANHTLRRIRDWGHGSTDDQRRTAKEIEGLQEELGKTYLDQEKRRIKEVAKEIIVAIENQKT